VRTAFLRASKYGLRQFSGVKQNLNAGSPLAQLNPAPVKNVIFQLTFAIGNLLDI
jgi:hypothetical protein